MVVELLVDLTLMVALVLVVPLVVVVAVVGVSRVAITCCGCCCGGWVEGGHNLSCSWLQHSCTSTAVRLA